MEVRESNGENSSGSKGGKFCIIVNIVNNSCKKILGNGYIIQIYGLRTTRTWCLWAQTLYYRMLDSTNKYKQEFIGIIIILSISIVSNCEQARYLYEVLPCD